MGRRKEEDIEVEVDDTTVKTVSAERLGASLPSLLVKTAGNVGVETS